MRTGVVGALVSVLLIALPTSAQSTFEVASVKANTTGNSGWFVEYTADSLRATNATLAALIQSAYGIMWAERLVGGPSWVRTRRFDVNAKAGQALPREQLRVMAQRLLENRFGVVLKREQREEQVYTLRLARADGRTGPDLRRIDGCDPETGGRSRTDPTRPAPRSSTGAAPTFYGWCAPIDGIAKGLTRQLGVEVVDRTGLPAGWDFVLAFTPLASTASPAVEAGQTSLPSIFVAVEEQLGLKLERDARGSVEYAVIAAARAPAED
jgi:uncharacterized protein (TIGR03435 family)